MGSWRAPSERVESLVALAHRLTDRDRAIISDLGRLRVLTLEQVARAHFTSRSSARDRLDTLRELGVVDRFRPSTRAAYRYVLAWTGLRFHQAAVEEERLSKPEFYREGSDKPRAAPSRPAAEALIGRLIANPMRAHLESVNDFYTRLAAASRPDPTVELVRWHSEAEATALMGEQMLRPDGAFDVEVHAEFWRCWFEHDTGTEPLTTLTAKARTYRATLSHRATTLSHFGDKADPQCLVIELTRPGREANLHPAIVHLTDRLVIVTCTVERSTHPLGAVWWVVGDPAGQFRRFAEIPTEPPGLLK